METDDPVARVEEDPFEKEVRAIFQDTLGLIHIALVTHYGLEEGEATELEKDLYLWFLVSACGQGIARHMSLGLSCSLLAASSPANTRNT